MCAKKRTQNSLTIGRGHAHTLDMQNATPTETLTEKLHAFAILAVIETWFFLAGHFRASNRMVRA